MTGLQPFRCPARALPARSLRRCCSFSLASRADSTPSIRRSREKPFRCSSPKVELTSSKVNQQEIRTYVGLVRAGFSDAELSSSEQQGREAIIQSIPQLGIIDAARAGAARALVPMLVKMGYREQDITVAFRRDFNPFNIRKLIEV